MTSRSFKPMPFKRSVSARSLRPVRRFTARVSRLAVMRGRGIPGETKGVDIPVTVSAFNTTGTVTLVNPIQEGAGFNNRIGRKTAMKSLHIVGDCFPTQAATGQSYCRMLVVYDKQSNGAAPTWANVIQSVDNAGTATNVVTDHLNLNNRDRFVILADWRQSFGATTAVSGVPSSSFVATSGEYTINRFIRLKNLEVQFNATANPATVAQIATGSIHVMTLGDQAPGAGYSVAWTSRLRFQDN